MNYAGCKNAKCKSKLTMQCNTKRRCSDTGTSYLGGKQLQKLDYT